MPLLLSASLSSRSILTACCVLLMGLGLIHCSPGDRDPLYHKCLSTCTCDSARRTNSGGWDQYWIYPAWSCADQCQYDCMHSVSAARQKQGYPIMKYHGHWPFLRYWDMEEPASVLFSLLNCLPNVIFFIECVTPFVYKRRAPSTLRVLLMLQSLTAMLAWLVSAVFHTRKTEFTTALDYCCALLFLATSLWLAFYRVFGIRLRPIYLWAVGTAFLGTVLWRIYLLSVGPIDFGQHMNICIGISALQTACWLYWSVFAVDPPNRSGIIRPRYLCLVCQLWFLGAASLELLDFPPYFGIFDAHSLWHVLTVPLGFLWSHFWNAEHASEDSKCC
jgi:hypothetical protein